MLWQAEGRNQQERHTFNANTFNKDFRGDEHTACGWIASGMAAPGCPNAVLRDRSSLVAKALVIAEGTATPGALTGNALTVDVTHTVPKRPFGKYVHPSRQL